MRAIAFVDYENIWTGLLSQGYELTPENLVQFLQRYTERMKIELLAIYLYANFDREEFWRTQSSFEKTNVFTRHVFSKNSFTNTNIRRNAADSELMLEAQEILLTRISTFDIILLLTGDGDFLPLVRKIRAWGKEVKVIGIDGSIHHGLQQYSEPFDVIKEMISSGDEEEYLPENDLEQGVMIIGQIQSRMPYVASTKARAALCEQLGRSVPQIKQLIKNALCENIIIEKEHSDPSLKIGRTKIYLLNLEHPIVKKVLGNNLNELKQRYAKLEDE